MRIAVTYAEPQQQSVVEFEIPEGITVKEAVMRSGILAKFPLLNLDTNKVGIFGKLVGLDQPLADGDRIEIYRPAVGKPPKKERGDAGGTEERPAAARPTRPAPAKTAPPATTEGTAQEATDSAQQSEPAPAAAATGSAGSQDTDRQARIAAAKARAAAARAKQADESPQT